MPNMPDVFRSAPPVESRPTPTESKSDATGSVQSDSDTTTYSTYSSDQGHPYTAKYYGIENIYDEGDLFSDEIKTVEGYFKSKIESGALADTTQAIRDQIKGIEKVAGIGKNEPTTMRISKLVAYVKFLQETDHLVKDQRKWT